MSAETGIAITKPVEAVNSLAEMKVAAEYIAKSRLFGLTTVDQVIALGMIAQAEGRPFASAARDYDCIQGRPAIKSQAALSRFQQAGGRIEYKERTAERVTATFSHPASGSVTVSWDMKRAAAMELSEKQNWKKQPMVMLTWRVISEGVRLCFPACLSGLYLVEEVQDFDVPKDITAEVTSAPPAPAAPTTPIAAAKEKVAKAKPAPKPTPAPAAPTPAATATPEAPAWKAKVIAAFEAKHKLTLADLEAWKGKSSADWTEDDRQEFLTNYKDPNFDADSVRVYIEKLKSEAAGEPQPGDPDPATDPQQELLPKEE